MNTHLKTQLRIGRLLYSVNLPVKRVLLTEHQRNMSKQTARTSKSKTA